MKDSVPAPVTGEPETVNSTGAPSATLVTLPSAVCHVWSPRRNDVLFAVPEPSLAVGTVPEVILVPAMFGVPERLITGVVVGFVIDIVRPETELFALTLVTVPAPPPPEPLLFVQIHRSPVGDAYA